MLTAIHLPKLDRLQPTLDSTLLKLMEEAGELARAVLKFLPYTGLDAAALAEQPVAAALLDEVTGELLDVAQTCVTMIFVMEDMPDMASLPTELLVKNHLHKLTVKGYRFAAEADYRIATQGSFKYLMLPRLWLDEVTLLTTVCKIQEELGELTQFLGKRAGASGESDRWERAAVLRGCAEELLDVAQCCFTMIYILETDYHINMQQLIEQHIAKLRSKGYCV